ncbi:hypothetical protein R1flu_002905 [Riccia fluitans]|uniref:Auxin-responsive protein n=1 Tax=Riccia fluitans TaxID=41844 RepID=A0ABD1Y7Z6_9MARC
MCQTGNSRGSSSGGTISLGHSVVQQPPATISSSWATQQHQDVQSAGAAAAGGVTPTSPQNSNQSGSTLKEHDLLGLSDVSSSTSRDSPQQENLQEGNEFEELNLMMELGPPAAKNKDPRTPAAVSDHQQQENEVIEKSSTELNDQKSSSNEALRLGMALNSQPGGTQESLLSEKKSFLNSIDRIRDSAATIELKQQDQAQPQDQQQAIMKQQQQQFERLKQQFESYQMVEKRSFSERRGPSAPLPLNPLQQSASNMEQRFQNVPDRSPRHADPSNNNRLWQNQIKFPSMVTSTAPYQQYPPPAAVQQDMDGNNRSGYSGSFPMNRNMFAQPKVGVTGAKRNYDSITDARNVTEPRNGGGLSGPSPGGSGPPSASEAEAKALAAVAAMVHQQQQQQMKAQMYQWNQKSIHVVAPPPPSWHMGRLEQSAGSFGPFPSSQRPASASASSQLGKSSSEAAAADCKSWDAQAKGSSHQESTSSQKAAPAETKQPTGEANSASKVEVLSTPSASTQRAPAAPAAVGWPPLRSLNRRNLSVVPPRPVPAETPAPPPRQSSTPASVSTTAVAGQSNSPFVKVNMDGYPVGRKVDLRINNSYEKLSQALDEMFRPQFETFLSGQNGPNRITLPSDLKRNFLQGPDFVLTYEDQDGDLMLVGDVPWTMFIENVKRLRIMKGSEAIGLGSRASEKSTKPSQTNV